MSRKILLHLLLLLIAAGCGSPWKTKSYYGYYFKTIPSDSSQLVMPYLVNTPFNERDAALSPDGQMLIYSFKYTNQYVLLYTELVKGIWTKPEIMPFSGKYSDLEPCFSPCGNFLFFSSNRPVDGEGNSKDYDLWMVKKSTDGWSSPVNLGPLVNSQYNEFYPSISEDMTLYFCCRNDKCIGGEDLWFSEQISTDQWGEPQNLGDSINTVSNEYNAFIHPQEKYIIFTTHGWGKGFGSRDLWVSFRKDNQKWTRPKNLGVVVNTPFFEYSPSITADGMTLFFTSNKSEQIVESDFEMSYNDIIKTMLQPANGNQNIYCIKTDFIENLAQ